MPRLPQVLSIPLIALALSAGSAAIGLAVNAIRPHRLPLVAPFPYEQDCPEKIDLSAPTVSVAQAVRLLGDKSVLFIDARPEEDFVRDHLPGARSLPLSVSNPVTAADIVALNKFRAVIVYCDSPDEGIARLQAAQLQQAGLQEVKVLLGGLSAFRKAYQSEELRKP